MTERTDEDILHLAESLRALGVRAFEDGCLRIEFLPPEPPAGKDTFHPEPARLRHEPEDAPPRPKNLREAAQRQGIGPLPFPGGTGI